MERRRFLRWTGAIASLPASAWLGGCRNEPEDRTEMPGPVAAGTPAHPPPAAFDDDPSHAVDLDLAGTLERARSLGKPALVLVTDPKDFYPRPDRATVFAQFLFDGGDEFWSDLALCEPACASHEEIRAVLPTAKLEGQPYFLLVEHDSGGPLVEVLQVKSPGPFDPESKPKAQRLALKADLEGWRSKLHEALAGDVPTLERRAEAARVALGPTAVSRVEALIQSGETVSDATLAGAAALFVLHARAHPDLGGKNKPLLEQQTRLRVMQDGLSGAGWGEHVSCNDPYLRRHGKVVSGPRVGIACGMGSLGPFGKRFLWYYTDERH